MDWLPIAQQDFGPGDLEVLKWRPKESRFLKMMLGNPVRQCVWFTTLMAATNALEGCNCQGGFNDGSGVE